MTRPDRRSRRRASVNMTACGPLRRCSLERSERPERPRLPLPRAPMRPSLYRMAIEQSSRDSELGLRLDDSRACPRKTPEQGDRNGHDVSHCPPGQCVRSMCMIDRKPPARPASYDTKVGLVLPHAPYSYMPVPNDLHHKILRHHRWPLQVTTTW